LFGLGEDSQSLKEPGLKPGHYEFNCKVKNTGLKTRRYKFNRGIKGTGLSFEAQGKKTRPYNVFMAIGL
jgi:hypothetical protein